jgi:hypothetical protein
MSLRRHFPAALVVLLLPRLGFAQKGNAAAAEVDDEAAADAAADKENEPGVDNKKGFSGTGGEDLGGESVGIGSKANSASVTRFFVDKADTEETIERTLVQGNLTLSTFYYSDSGGLITANTTSNSPFKRFFTDLRFQADALHLRGGAWSARFDGRLRVTSDPDKQAAGLVPTSSTCVSCGWCGPVNAPMFTLDVNSSPTWAQ